jgi:hypothetical protein
MDHRLLEPEKQDIDFKYDGPLPTNDLISYKNMMMEMSHSAMTDGSCLSLVAFGIFTIVCILGLSVLFNMLFFH